MPTSAPPATRTALVRRARRMGRILGETYPDAHCELDFDSPYQLLVATILSAQCTDVRVNMVTPKVFAAYPTPADLAAADRAELESMIESTGFFRAKSASLQGMAARLVEAYGGEVPGRLKDLVTLPGVGRKTANVVLGNAFGGPGDHRRHALRPAVPALRMDHRGGPREGRGRGRLVVPASRTGRCCRTG